MNIFKSYCLFFSMCLIYSGLYSSEYPAGTQAGKVLAVQTMIVDLGAACPSEADVIAALEGASKNMARNPLTQEQQKEIYTNTREQLLQAFPGKPLTQKEVIDAANTGRQIWTAGSILARIDANKHK